MWLEQPCDCFDHGDNIVHIGKTTAQKGAHVVKDGIRHVYATAVGDTTKAYWFFCAKIHGGAKMLKFKTFHIPLTVCQFNQAEEGSGVIAYCIAGLFSNKYIFAGGMIGQFGIMEPLRPGILFRVRCFSASGVCFPLPLGFFLFQQKVFFSHRNFFPFRKGFLSTPKGILRFRYFFVT